MVFLDKHFSHGCYSRDLASSFDIPVIKGSMSVQNNFTQLPYILSKLNLSKVEILPNAPLDTANAVMTTLPKILE